MRASNRIYCPFPSFRNPLKNLQLVSSRDRTFLSGKLVPSVETCVLPDSIGDGESTGSVELALIFGVNCSFAAGHNGPTASGTTETCICLDRPPEIEVCLVESVPESNAIPSNHRKVGRGRQKPPSSVDKVKGEYIGEAWAALDASVPAARAIFIDRVE